MADLIQHGGDAPGLLRHADRALCTAKATGRNRVAVAGDDEPAAVADEADDERASPNGRSAG